MSKKSSSKTNFLAQGTILVIASFVAKAIGMIYRIPLTHILGDDGNGYYSTANEIYTIILMISSFSLPLAVSRLVAEREYAGEVKNSYKVLICSLRFAAVTGGILSILTFLLGGVITKYVMGVELASYALRVLAPAIFLFALTGVLRGFFQGHGTMVPTAVSQIIEQIINAIVSVAGAYVMLQYGLKLGEKKGDAELGTALAAAGGTFGTVASVGVALLFMIVIYLGYRNGFKRRMKKDKTRRRESDRAIYRAITYTILPIVLSTLVYNISTIIDQGVFNHRTDAYGGSAENRARFAVEAVRAVRSRLPELPIDYKLAVRQEDPHYGNAGVLESELGIFVPLLVEAGVTSFHVTLANHSSLEDTIPPANHPYFKGEGCFLKFCDEVRQYTQLPLCGVGGLTQPDFIEQQLASGRITCAAMSRQLLADPEWPNKVASGQIKEIHRCVRCNKKCLGGLQQHQGTHCIYEKV